MRPNKRRSFELLEKRELLAFTPFDASLFASGLGYKDPHVIAAISALTTTGSTEPITLFKDAKSTLGSFAPSTAQSTSLINLDDFRSDGRFSGINGAGFSTVILDTGIDLNHPYFGPDANSDGISDRIVFSYDFADGDGDASDVDGHGSNVSSVVASSSPTHPGMAPGVNIIHLKVFPNTGEGNFGMVESALQWVVANAASYNIASVNMSLGDTSNRASSLSLYGIGDELAALAAINVIVASASGNDFGDFASVQGVAYPAADPNSLSVGAVFDSAIGGVSYGTQAIAHSTGPGRITPFSQRHSVLTDIMAPGAPITGANQSGGTVTQHGTSQASPHISGIAVLAQQLAVQVLGRRLTLSEFRSLLKSTSTTINDGDDEDDNVTNTGLNFPLVDVLALGEAIWAMGSTPSANATAANITLASNHTQELVVTYSDDTGIDVSQLDDNDIRVTGPNGYIAFATFQGVDALVASSPRVASYTISTPGASWDFADNGTYWVEMLPNQVFDLQSNGIPPGLIGTFEVYIAPELGPDGFGYYASSVPEQFIDISSSGTLVLAGADDAASQINPGNGFGFTFYGIQYTSVFVSSNGLITFGGQSTAFTNTDLSSSPSFPTIAAYWDDLHALPSGGVFWQLVGSDDRQSLILQWETEFWNDSGNISFQAILNQYDGSVRINYRDLIGGNHPGEGGSATIGIKSGGTQGVHRLVPVFNQALNPYSRNGRSFDFFLGNRAPLGLSLNTAAMLETMPVGQVIATLSADDHDAADTHAFTLVTGPGAEDNEAFTITGNQLRLATPLDFETKQTYNLRLRATDAAGLFIETQATLSVIDVAEMIGLPVFGDGTSQRTLIEKIVITFENDVDIDPAAFELVRRGVPGESVATTFVKELNALGQTEVVLSFSGSLTRGPFNALLDGYYQLTIDGTKISRNGIQLDFNQDGTTGDNFVIGDQATDDFFALFGDSGGDGLVGIAEFGQFRSAFGKTPSQTGYNRLFDYDGFGVGIADFGQFRSRFGRAKLPWV